MTKTVTIEETEYMGAVTTRFVEVDITNYDDEGDGDGEEFVPADVSMRRFQAVIPEVKDGTGLTASYDESAGSIRLFGQNNDGTGTATDNLTEVPSNNTEGATLTVICMGR
ncbi:hypothetical protein HCTV5_121 [Halovirus HCTV-5]|uniref:hypothetical protein n=1 Tax=Halovirus HCTV-5 TaxID=1273748 RepID=UPI0003348B5B|nr:hypothetical protein M200_gp107 [Halovirus HCTV-5]AGM11727.1 hypothetical protein HCTV5_121 [Halovirus HCTV-5]